MKGSVKESGNGVIRAGALLVMVAITVTGCDYWPPALQAQIERLRIDVQKVSEDRMKLEGQLNEARKANQQLQARIIELTRINQEQVQRIASLEQSRRTAREQSRTARSATSSDSKSARKASARKRSEGVKGGRVLQLERPPMKGPDVKSAQQALRQAGIAVSVDGLFGPSMEAAVKRFQQQKGLPEDGVLGPGTWSALARVSSSEKHRVLQLERPHMQGHDVKAVQQALQKTGVQVTVDGVFGPSMQTAVRHFQRKKGLIPDGVVGPSTWAALGL